jgi:hypothetical protein
LTARPPCGGNASCAPPAAVASCEWTVGYRGLLDWIGSGGGIGGRGNW